MGGPGSGAKVRIPLAERFWTKVDQTAGPDGCWPWTGSRDDGYGNFLDERGYTDKAHRVAWRLAKWPVPPGMCVLHRCDNPPCCNPAHLWLGTRKYNNMDRALKGRSNHRTPTSKLSEDQVREIRRRCLGERQPRKEVAAAFGITVQALGQILLRRTWAFVQD